jgi:hypothetical protein
MLGLLIVDRPDLSLISRTHEYQIIIAILEEFSIEAISCHFFLVERVGPAISKSWFLSERIAVNKAATVCSLKILTIFERAIR